MERQRRPQGETQDGSSESPWVSSLGELIYGKILLETALNEVKPRVGRVLIIGSGTGYEAIALAKLLNVTVDAADIMPAAVELGRINAIFHAVPGVRFIESDLFQTIQSEKYEFIVFNAPARSRLSS